MAENELMPAAPGYVRTSVGERISWADALNTIYNGIDILVNDKATRDFESGNSFAAGYMWANIAIDAVVTLHIFTGAYPALLSFNVSGTALTEYGAYTAPTITDDGAALTILHRNKLIDVTPTATIYRDPTYTGGTIEIQRFLGSGTNTVSRSGGTISGQSALILPNTHYVFTAKNVSGAVQDRMGIAVDWRQFPT